MANPYREGQGWSIRAQHRGEEIYRSGFASAAAARRFVEERKVAIGQVGRPARGGPERTILAVALSDYARERLTYLSIREEVLRQERHVGELTAGLARMNQSAIQKQLDVDLSSVIDLFLSDAEKPERTRVLLKRIFPSIVLLGKEDRYTALFEVHVKPAAIVAEATATNELISEPDTIIKLRLRTSSSKFPVWSVEELLPA